MTKIQLNTLFKKIQKDDKKEILEFHVQGSELPHSNDLVRMAGTISIININESEAGDISAEFASLQRDSKKTTLKFNIKGDTDGKIIKLYPHAGSSINLSLQPSQMSIDEFYDNEGKDKDGIEYKVDKSGTVNVDQVTIDQVENELEVEENEEDLLLENAFNEEKDEDELE